MKKNILSTLLVMPVLFFFVVFIGSNLNAHAQGNLPPGSYKETCKDIQRMAGNILWANCQKADGSYHRSKLILAECEGDISNNNGVLTCKKSPGKQPPNGSYKNSCRNIRVDGKQLKAQCERKNGSWKNSSLKYKKCKGDISNDNGNLSCDGGGGKKNTKRKLQRNMQRFLC